MLNLFKKTPEARIEKVVNMFEAAANVLNRARAEVEQKISLSENQICDANNFCQSTRNEAQFDRNETIELAESTCRSTIERAEKMCDDEVLRRQSEITSSETALKRSINLSDGLNRLINGDLVSLNP